MSFDLGVFYTEKSLTDEAALERYAAYCEQDDLTPYIEPSPRVAAFVKDLTGQYPQLHDVPDEELEDCPWSAAFDVSEGHVLMCMTYFWAPDMTDLIVGLAQKHGLVCVCPQSGEILTAPPKLLRGPAAKRLSAPSAAETPKPQRPSLSDVVAEISRSLAGLGFVQHRKDEFTRDMNEDVVAYIGLNGRESRSQSELEPVIGLRHHGVTDLVRAFDKSKVYTALPLSHQTYLRDVTPRRRSVTPHGHIGLWRFSDGEGETVARDIVAEIEAHAIPFFEAHASLRPLAMEMLARNRDCYQTAAGLYLLERYEETLLYLEAQLVEMASDDEAPCKAFRAFARELLGRMTAAGTSVPPERQALLESLMATPQPKGDEGGEPYFREQPFVELFDELLPAQGFRRDGLVWRKEGRHSCIAVTLEAGLIDRISVDIDFRIFGEMKAAASDRTAPRASLFLLRLAEICPRPLALKLKRALCFHHDYANSGVFDINWVDAHLRGPAAVSAMEPDVPLTMEWRLAALREAMADHALPLFRQLEASRLSRIKWTLINLIYGFDLGNRAP